MNCFSMMPSYVFSNPFQAQFPAGISFSRDNQVISAPRVLNAISEALNKSLRNFEEKCAKTIEISEDA